MRRTRVRPAQIFSLDLIFAMMVFSFIFGAFILLNSTVSSSVSSAEFRAEIMEDSQTALLALIATPGSPSNWSLYDFASPESSAVTSIGLAESPFSLSTAKLSKLQEMNSTNYTALKEFLAIFKPNHEFHFSIRYNNGTTVSLAGNPRPSQNLTSTTASAFVLSSGKPAVASLMIWVGDSFK